MRSERKFQNTVCCRTILAALAALVFCLAALGLAVFLRFQTYEKELCDAAAFLQADVPSPSQLLKGQESLSKEEAIKVLNQAGYKNGMATVFYDRFRSDTAYFAAGIAVLYIICLCLLIANCRHRIREFFRESEALESALLSIREGSFAADVMPEESRILQQLIALNDFCQTSIERSREESNSTKALITDISHQIKTPVAALDTSLSVLEQGGLSQKEQEEFMVLLRSSLKSLEGLLDALVQISRMETGMITMNFSEALVFDTLLAAVNEIYPRAAAKQIEMQVEEAEALDGLALRQDSRWLREVFVNVLDNAVKYSPHGSMVTVRAMKRPSFLRLEFSDQGIGISKEEYHKIFQRFYRGSSLQVRNAEGAGVGLYLAREILSMHGGTISVSSQKTGSTFVIHLPYRG